MAAKKKETMKDMKGRKLRIGETQNRSGTYKGRYEYQYSDNRGNRHHVYSWRLVPTDKLPEGKYPCESLREKEEQIKQILEKGLAIDWQNATLNDVFEEYMKGRPFKATSEQNNRDWWRRYLREFGKAKIRSIHYTEIKNHYIYLRDEKNLSKSTMKIVNSLLSSVFKEAIKMEIVEKNPTENILSGLIANAPEKKEKTVLSKKQLEAFLEFIKQDRVYYPFVMFLFFTGCRFGEAAGLIWSDIDYDNNLIYIRRDLENVKKDGHYKLIIQTPKTEKGIRTVYLPPELKKELKALQIRNTKNTLEIDGVTGFCFFNRDGRPMSNGRFHKYLKDKVDLYNSYHEEQLPHLSAHVARHSYASILAAGGVDPKMLQSLLGHRDISTTLNIYTHVNADMLEKQTDKIEASLSF